MRKIAEACWSFAYDNTQAPPASDTEAVIKASQLLKTSYFWPLTTRTTGQFTLRAFFSILYEKVRTFVNSILIASSLFFE